jgi:hypothetical protein
MPLANTHEFSLINVTKGKAGMRRPVWMGPCQLRSNTGANDRAAYLAPGRPLLSSSVKMRTAQLANVLQITALELGTMILRHLPTPMRKRQGA